MNKIKNENKILNIISNLNKLHSDNAEFKEILNNKLDGIVCDYDEIKAEMYHYNIALMVTYCMLGINVILSFILILW